MPATQPVDVVNRALDECGCDEIGDMEDGSVAAKAATRIYTPTLRQLLSAVHWNFARKQFPMELLADRSGFYITNTDVPQPWCYMYDWPVDAVHARFVPAMDGTLLDENDRPIMGAWASPTPFLVASAPRPNPIDSNWFLIEGHDPDQTRVILSNQYGAHLVYTGLMQYPDAWDPLFEQAMVALLAARLAMPCQSDKKFARVVRQDNILIAREAVGAARVRDGDEGWTVQDHTPDWIMARTSGISWGGPGVLSYPWMSIPMLGDAGAVY